MLRVKEYVNKQQQLKTNSVNYIPFYGLNGLNKYLPGFIPGVMYKFTSHTGNGKTQLTKYMTFTSLITSIKKGKKVKLVYVALEESKEEFMDSLYLHIVNVYYKVPLFYFDLMGYSGKALTKIQTDALLKAEQFIKKEVLPNLHLITDVYTSSEIFYEVTKIAKLYGTVGDFDDSFKPDDPSMLFMLVVDHVSLIKDKEISNFESIYIWHTQIAKRIISKEWKWIIIHVQQQKLDAEKQH